MTTTLPPSSAHTLPAPLRNAIYSSLLSSGGIRTIECTLTQALQTSGFQATLRAYITDLFRTGQATTAPEAYALAMERIRVCMAEDEGSGGNGKGEGNGNGNGVNGNGSGIEGDGVDLRVPEQVVREGGRVVRREVERVVEIEME